jgi:ribosomal protein S18 acetylase RimI-like enzyme
MLFYMNLRLIDFKHDIEYFSVCRDAKEAGVSAMALGVEKNNHPAIHLYEREGFKIVGEEDIRFIMIKELQIY